MAPLSCFIKAFEPDSVYVCVRVCAYWSLLYYCSDVSPVSLQKLVKACPLGATKPLSLIKPPGQGIAISVVPTKVPVSMVTAHLNGQKVASSEPLHTSPINLQTGVRAVGAGVLPLPRRGPELPPSQVSSDGTPGKPGAPPGVQLWGQTSSPPHCGGGEVSGALMTLLMRETKALQLFKSHKRPIRGQQAQHLLTDQSFLSHTHTHTPRPA